MNADAPMNEEEPSLKRLRGGDDDPLLDSTAAAPPPLVAPAVVRPFRAMASVVKLFVVQAEPNYAQPWCGCTLQIACRIFGPVLDS